MDIHSSPGREGINSYYLYVINENTVLKVIVKVKNY